MGLFSSSKSSSSNSTSISDNRLVMAEKSLGNTGTFSAGNIDVTDSSTNFDPAILDNAFKYLSGVDAAVTDRTFATLATADNTASNVIGAASKFGGDALAASQNIAFSNNALARDSMTMSSNVANSAISQGVNLANIGAEQAKISLLTSSDFASQMIGAANNYVDGAFKSGMDATGAAYNAVSEINSAASNGASVLPDIKNQLVVAVVSGVVLYFITHK